MEKHVEQTFSLNKEKLKFIRLICNKCRNVISKNFTIKEKFKIENKDETNGLFVSKLIYLKSIFLSNKTKLKNKGENVFLYQHVKCVQCARKIGKFIKSAAGKKFDYIDSVIFTHYDIVIEEYEQETDEEIEKFMKYIKYSENIMKLQDKEKLLKIFHNAMDDTNKKLSDLDIFFENIVSDFQSHLERIEEIKLILNKMWNEVKGKKEKNSVSDLSHISQKDIDKILSGSKNDKQVPPYKSRDDKNSISKDESVVMIKNLDFSGLENDKNFKKDKSYLGTNYRDQTINFSKIEKIDCINLKRKNNNHDYSFNPESLNKNINKKKKSSSKI